MKYYLLLGGFLGFSALFIGGIAVGNDLTTVLRNACIGCVAGGFLMRGFRALLAHQVRQLSQQQQANSQTAAPSATALR